MHAPVEEVLGDRKKTHGDFAVHARITQGLKNEMHGGPRWEYLNDSQREALEMIVHKIGRILAGNPGFADHWIDIAGYATLVAKQCQNSEP
jgi:hypothetical protein